jgi:hypothetical protein
LSGSMRSLHDAGLFERPIPLFEAETRERDLRAIGDGVRAIGVDQVKAISILTQNFEIWGTFCRMVKARGSHEDG